MAKDAPVSLKWADHGKAIIPDLSMRFHKSVTSGDLINRGPSKVAMMVDSEFWRACPGAEFPSQAVRALWKARELMGVLEMMELPDRVSQLLRPHYDRCRLQATFDRLESLSAKDIQEFSGQLAEAFDEAAKELAHA